MAHQIDGYAVDVHMARVGGRFDVHDLDFDDLPMDGEATIVMRVRVGDVLNSGRSNGDLLRLAVLKPLEMRIARGEVRAALHSQFFPEHLLDEDDEPDAQIYDFPKVVEA